MMEKSTANPQIAKPVTNGRTVPLKALAITIPMGIEMREEREPITAAPTPAMCPNGSIARAFRFPKRKAIPGKTTIMKAMNSHKEGIFSIQRMPNRKTVDKPVITAALKKQSFLRPNW